MGCLSNLFADNSACTWLIVAILLILFINCHNGTESGCGCGCPR